MPRCPHENEGVDDLPVLAVAPDTYQLLGWRPAPFGCTKNRSEQVETPWRGVARVGMTGAVVRGGCKNINMLWEENTNPFNLTVYTFIVYYIILSYTVETLYESASKIYAWSVFVSLLSVPYRFPWFWVLQV